MQRVRRKIGYEVYKCSTEAGNEFGSREYTARERICASDSKKETRKSTAGTTESGWLDYPPEFKNAEDICKTNYIRTHGKTY